MQHQAQLQHEGPTLWSVPQPEVNSDFACMPSNDQAAAVAKQKPFTDDKVILTTSMAHSASWNIWTDTRSCV